MSGRPLARIGLDEDPMSAWPGQLVFALRSAERWSRRAGRVADLGMNEQGKEGLALALVMLLHGGDGIPWGWACPREAGNLSWLCSAKVQGALYGLARTVNRPISSIACLTLDR